MVIEMIIDLYGSGSSNIRSSDGRRAIIQPPPFYGEQDAI